MPAPLFRSLHLSLLLGHLGSTTGWIKPVKDVPQFRSCLSNQIAGSGKKSRGLYKVRCRFFQAKIHAVLLIWFGRYIVDNRLCFCQLWIDDALYYYVCKRFKTSCQSTSWHWLKRIVTTWNEGLLIILLSLQKMVHFRRKAWQPLNRSTQRTNDQREIYWSIWV